MSGWTPQRGVPTTKTLCQRTPRYHGQRDYTSGAFYQTRRQRHSSLLPQSNALVTNDNLTERFSCEGREKSNGFEACRAAKFGSDFNFLAQSFSVRNNRFEEKTHE